MASALTTEVLLIFVFCPVGRCRPGFVVMLFLEPTQVDGGTGAGLGPYAKGEGVDSIGQPSRFSDSVSHMVGRLLSIVFVSITHAIASACMLIKQIVPGFLANYFNGETIYHLNHLIYTVYTVKLQPRPCYANRILHMQAAVCVKCTFANTAQHITSKWTVLHSHCHKNFKISQENS